MENRRFPPTPGGFALTLQSIITHYRNARRRSKLVCAEEASFHLYIHFPLPHRSSANLFTYTTFPKPHFDLPY